MTVTRNDIADEIGVSVPDEGSTTERQWLRWIEDARLILRVGDGTRTGLGDLSLLDQDVVDYVVLHAVAAQAKNSDNATQVDVQIDDGRISRRYESSTGRVGILPEWWGMLDPDLTTVGAFTITPYSVRSDYACVDAEPYPC